MSEKLLILAGGGGAPTLARRRAMSAGMDILTVALAPGVKADFHPRLARLPELLLSLKAKGYRRVVLAGSLSRYRTTEQLTGNKQIAAFLDGKSGGDNYLLTQAIRYMRLHGFKPMRLTELFEPLLATVGAMNGRKPSERALDGVRVAAAAVRKLGKFDVGQAVVIQGRNILAVEGAEGTDRMMERGAELAWAGGDGVILIKAMKTGQSKYADLPAIGMDTLKNAAKLGFDGIAVEAGAVLIIDKPQVGEYADENGLFLWGFRRSLSLF